ncbi:MFS transporter [Paenibacillus sp. FA6]|uniref:MFS transporter n=1 Tax=Paenibacillus sp. FA6 TaxID=3413029 RepID=UPI003F6552B9
MNPTKERALIFSFTFMAFMLGTTEYLIVGLLPNVANSLKITLALAGSLVSGFAIAYAIGAPIVMTAVSRLPKRSSILSLMVLIILFNLLCAVSPSFGVLLFIRMITGIMCGVAISLAISLSSDVISSENRGKAISYILSGFAISNVLGVPLGNLVGQYFEWPAAFVLVAILGLVAFILNFIYVPRHYTKTNISLQDQVGLLKNGRVILAFLIPVLGISAIFVIYTYITPILEDIMHISKESVSIVLLVYGIAAIVSSWLGGKVATGNAIGKLRFVFIIQAIIFASFSLTASLPVLGLLSLFLIGGVSYILNTTTQLYLIDLAARYSPKAKDLAASLNASAANFGIAIGAAIGGFVADNIGLIHLPWVASILSLGACVLTAWSYHLDTFSKKVI